ncbi:MAG: hypothetical protein V4754_11170 [Pseudomonadota bacterium]
MPDPIPPHAPKKLPVIPGVSPSSLAFFVAVRDAGLDSSVPHPVHARNTGLVQAWLRWDVQREHRLDAMLSDHERRFTDNSFMVGRAMSLDPAYRLGHVTLSSDPRDLDVLTNSIAAQLMYWRCKHTLFELTPALEQWLVRSDLGDDIPFDLLRPPVPACYISFGPELRQAVQSFTTDQAVFDHVKGVYVMESYTTGRRAITLLPVFVFEGRPLTAVGAIEMICEDEQMPLTAAIQRLCVGVDADIVRHHRSVAQLCVKVFLYLRVQQAQLQEEQPHTAALAQLRGLGPKKAAKLQRQLGKLYDRVLLGPPMATVEHGTPHEVAPHWRRGHFRMQAHGPERQLRKVLFIAPMVIRADRL